MVSGEVNAVVDKEDVWETRESEEEIEAEELDEAERAVIDLMSGASATLHRERVIDWEQSLMESYARAHLVPFCLHTRASYNVRSSRVAWSARTRTRWKTQRSFLT